MLTCLDSLRQMSTLSVLLRLMLAMFFGGMIGLNRERHRRPAGFRTYMMVCVGATLTVLLSEYETWLLEGQWLEIATMVGVKTDMSRFGAQVINGIGFLGAGCVLVTGRQEVKGLTTAAGLWASAIVGLAIGAGFYECVALAFVLINVSIRLLQPIENLVVERARNMNIYVEFESLDDVGLIINRIKEQNIAIYEVDIDHGGDEAGHLPSAIFSLHLNQIQHHARIMAAISELESVRLVDEI